MEQLLEAVKRWAADFQVNIDRLEALLDTRVREVQAKILERMLVILDWLERDGKSISGKPSNIRVLRRIDTLWAAAERDEIADLIREFSIQIRGVGADSVKYYALFGDTSKRIEETAEAALLASIGLDENGDVLPGGYLGRLGQSAEVRQELRNYVLSSIVSRKKAAEFEKGLKTLIVGGRDIDGALIRYWRQYAYDAYNQAHEVTNAAMAQGLGMRYFIYQGSIIPTTRAFCRKRAGKVFSVAETEAWKNDPDLIEKRTKATYNPLIERGRYNCRHFLTYISEDLANHLRK